MAKTPGYSGKALGAKLGLKEGVPLIALRAPEGYAEWLQAGFPVELKSRLPKEPRQVHAFFASKADAAERLPAIAAALHPEGWVWVSWKKGGASDLKEDDLRELALAHGLVDVKVCAVSDEWSGLKLMVPVAKRPARAKGR